MKRESAILKDIRAALNRTRQVRLLRNNVGTATTEYGGFIRFGIGRGSPDLVGILREGRVFCIEAKRPGEDLDPHQRAWWSAYRKWNGLGGVAKSVEEAMALLHAALVEARRIP